VYRVLIQVQLPLMASGGEEQQQGCSLSLGIPENHLLYLLPLTDLCKFMA
jgi:hypothetical protein